MRPSEAEVLDIIQTYSPITNRAIAEISSYCRRTISNATRVLIQARLIEKRVYVHDPRQYLYSSVNEERAS